MTKAKKKQPAKKKAAAKKKVEVVEPVAVVEEEEVKEPDMSVVPLDFKEEDDECDCGEDVCDKCFFAKPEVEVSEEPESEPQPEEVLVDEPQRTIPIPVEPEPIEEVKPKVAKKPATDHVKIGGSLVRIRI